MRNVLGARNAVAALCVVSILVVIVLYGQIPTSKTEGSANVDTTKEAYKGGHCMKMEQLSKGVWTYLYDNATSVDNVTQWAAREQTAQWTPLSCTMLPYTLADTLRCLRGITEFLFVGDSVIRWLYIDVVKELTGILPSVAPGRPTTNVHGISFTYIRVTGLERKELLDFCEEIQPGTGKGKLLIMNFGMWELRQQTRYVRGFKNVLDRYEEGIKIVLSYLKSWGGDTYWKQVIMYNNMLDTKPGRKGEKTLMPDAVIAFNEKAGELLEEYRDIPILPSFKVSSGTFDCYHGSDGLHPCAKESLTEFEIMLNHYCNSMRVQTPQPKNPTGN